MNFSFEQAIPVSPFLPSRTCEFVSGGMQPCRKQSPYAPTAERTGHPATDTAAIVVLRSPVPDLFRSCTTRSMVPRLSFGGTHAKSADTHGPRKEWWTMRATVPGAEVLLRLWKIRLHHRLTTRTIHSPLRFFQAVSGKSGNRGRMVLPPAPEQRPAHGMKPSESEVTRVA